MKITMILPFTALTGGTKVMIEYANRLQAKGHDVTLIYPWYHTSPHSFKAWIKGPIKGLVNLICRTMGIKEIRWMTVRVPVKAVRQLSDAYLSDADLLIATENQTIDPLESVSEKKGRKVYFIQHYEIWTRDKNKVDATWQSNKWHKVTIATWLKKLAEEKFDSTADLVVNGIDLKAFNDKGKKWNTPPRILSLYHHLEWKGVQDMLTALKRIKEAGIPFVPVFFGHLPPGEDLKTLGMEVEYHQSPSAEQLRQLYAEADIFVSASWAEGCQLPPMEAMACGTALVATNVGGVPDYTIPSKTALVVPPKQPEELAKAITELINNPEKMRAIAEAGHKHIQNFSWDQATNKFEAILKRIAK